MNSRADETGQVHRDLGRLAADADGVVLFGSRACGCETARSDFDVLCIGSGPRYPGSSLDVVWVTRARLESEEWLGSELAGHIARYGRVIAGDGDWMRSTFISEAALTRKAHAVTTRLKVLQALGDCMGEVRRREYGTRVRRDIQRLHLLTSGAAVPPAAFLDRDWTEGVHTPELLMRTVAMLGLAIPRPLPHSPPAVKFDHSGISEACRTRVVTAAFVACVSEL